MKKIGIAADHGGYDLKEYLKTKLYENGFEVTDFGNSRNEPDDDYPDYILPMADAVASGEVFRGVAVCGSGVGACIAANKISGARACLINDIFSSHQGVEDDDMNIICLGGRVTGNNLAWELLQSFLSAEFSGLPRHIRRLERIKKLE